jgi:hypothetical protein
VQFTFAMLEILTKRPGGWATLDELGREIAATHGQEASSRFRELCDVDVLGAGLVVEDNNGLRITKAGRSVLRALEALHGTHPESHMPNQSRSQKAIDDVMGAGVRQELLNLGLRAAGEKLILESLEGEQEDIETEPEVISSEMSSDLASEPEAVVDMAERTVEGSHLGKARQTDISTAISFNVPAFLNITSRATIKALIRLRSRNYILFPSVAASLKRFTGILRGHIEQDAPKIKPGGPGGGIGGVILTVFVLLAIIICAGTVIAVNQIRSLKSEITSLERQLVSLKKQAANAEQQEKRNSADERDAALKAAATDQSKPTDEGPSRSTNLILSPDEMRLIREYIKPAPFGGPTARPINVGDPVTIGTIPLPSPLTDKIPKLLGARFTIHNGSIILVKRDSRQADAVLGPN